MTGFVEKLFLARWPVIANGPELAEYVQFLAPGRTDILTVSSSVLSSKDLPAPRTRYSIAGTVGLLYVGRVAPEKGLQDLIAALVLLAARRESLSFSLRIVGWTGHGELERLQKLVENAGLSGTVHFEGPKEFGPELFECYEGADIFVLPSRSEGTPRVLVEAMAFGLPIVAARLPGVACTITDGVNGLLFTPGHVEELAAVLVRLASDERMRAAAGRQNAKDAKTQVVEALVAKMMPFLDARTT